MLPHENLLGLVNLRLSNFVAVLTLESTNFVVIFLGQIYNSIFRLEIRITGKVVLRLKSILPLVVLIYTLYFVWAGFNLFFPSFKNLAQRIDFFSSSQYCKYKQTENWKTEMKVGNESLQSEKWILKRYVIWKKGNISDILTMCNLSI